MSQPLPNPAGPGSNPPLARSAAEDLARTLRAVADPTRLQLLSVILDSADGRATVTQLTEALDQVKSKLATYREDAREIEVENVAIVN